MRKIYQCPLNSSPLVREVYKAESLSAWNASATLDDLRSEAVLAHPILE